MYESHYYTLHKVCPCKISEDVVRQSIEIFQASADAEAYTSELERRRIIGKRIWFDKEENTIYITKVYASTCGEGHAGNTTLIGERCHCSHYNHASGQYPTYYCKCGAEFYRPMFAPLFGDDILLEPYKTVLSGDEECVIAVRLGRTEAEHAG